MKLLLHRILWRCSSGLVAAALVLCASFHAVGFDDEKERADKAAGSKTADQLQSPIDVYEWSIWTGNPANPAINAARLYKNAMPGVVGTSRPKLEDKEQAAKFPIAPISVVQFFGEPRRDVDIDVRAKKGSILRTGRPARSLPDGFSGSARI